jgi:hypothetical protein
MQRKLQSLQHHNLSYERMRPNAWRPNLRDPARNRHRSMQQVTAPQYFRDVTTSENLPRCCECLRVLVRLGVG